MIGGYGLGQGSLFLAQTFLLWHGDLERIAFFGTCFTFAILSILLVDAGSITTLARHTAQARAMPDGAERIWRCFSAVVLVRLAVTSVLVTAGAALLVTTDADRDVLVFAACFAPALFVWSLNAAGILDGLEMSGISGLSGSAPYIAGALALLFAHEADLARPGALIGGAMACGYGLAVAIQAISLRLSGLAPRLRRPCPSEIRRAATEGLSVSATMIPGQLYFRAQLLICSAILGVSATAVLIYVNQIVSALGQLTGFIRRVEFPRLVTVVNGPAGDSVGAILAVQRLGLIIAGTAALGTGLVAALLVARPSGHNGETLAAVLPALAAYAPTILTTAIMLSLAQGLNAAGRYPLTAAITLPASLAGLAVSTTLAKEIGVAAFAGGEIVANLVGILLMVTFLSPRTRKTS